MRKREEKCGYRFGKGKRKVFIGRDSFSEDIGLLTSGGIDELRVLALIFLIDALIVRHFYFI